MYKPVESEIKRRLATANNIVITMEKFDELFNNVLSEYLEQLEMSIRFYGDVLGQDFSDDIVEDKADEIVISKLGISNEILDKILHGEYEVRG